MSSPPEPFTSYAQNFEDVVLWRVLHDVEEGFYVDVGACDPVADSISWGFYEQGWHGALVEPVPSWAAALRRRRPRDITIEAAAGVNAGTARLFASPSTGNSSLLRDVRDRLAGTGVEFAEIAVRVAPLDDLLEEAGLDGRTIHFCTIDVEGAEADVLTGFDLDRWRPWILVVEATEPNRPRPSHGSWEKHVIDAGYQFCLFDGLNRFYVHPDKAEDFAERLSYPACVFDDAFYRAVAGAHRVGEVERVATEATQRAAELERAATEATRRAAQLRQAASRVAEIERENAALLGRTENVTAQLNAMKATVSWRVTRPLRTLRAKQVRVAPESQSATREALAGPASAGAGDIEAAFAERLMQAAELLFPGSGAASDLELNEALAALEESLRSSTAPDSAKAWLSLVTVAGSFPGERSVDRLARIMRLDGAAGVRSELLGRFALIVEQGLAPTSRLDILRDQVVVDVTHTVSADLHTGIQRVVRETVAYWIGRDRPLHLVWVDLDVPAARLLAPTEYDRLRHWRSFVGSGRTISERVPELSTGNTLVPWGCSLVIPELPSEPARADAYRALAHASVLRSLSISVYDLIPMIASETVATVTTTNFGGYLSVVKHADRVSAISRTSANGFSAFATMTAAEGLARPAVEAHVLPAEAPELDPERVDRARIGLGLGALPVVLAVGSHEPRKNHLALLEAAERLWSDRGHTFELLLIGGSSWLTEEFDDLVERLLSADRPVTVHKRCTEEELWAAYRLARFSVFPSLLEGYGLPIAESLASGTPVITSNHGSMAEVAEKGGCVLIDPRNIDDLERAMALLLDDDETLSKLRDEALAADTGTWERYATELWEFFTKPVADVVESPQ